MAKVILLKEKLTNEKSYPISVTEAVYHNGLPLDLIVDNKAEIEDLSNVLAETVVDSDTFDLYDSVTREVLKKDLFDDMWLKKVGIWGGIDREGHPEAPYLLNELYLTYKEALDVVAAGLIESTHISGLYYADPRIRTNLPINLYSGNPGSTIPGFTCIATFANLTNVEIINLSYRTSRHGFKVTSGALGSDHFISGCPKLRKILGSISFVQNSPTLINNLPLLETVHITALKFNLLMHQCPKINLESFLYLVSHKTHLNYNPTITVHPDIYAKLIDESNTEWHQVLLDGIKKNITFATK